MKYYKRTFKEYKVEWSLGLNIFNSEEIEFWAIELFFTDKT